MAAIIFDMDGTLADSFDYVADFMAGEAGRGPLTTAQKDSLRHLSMNGMARELGFHWWDAPWLYFRGRRRMHQAITDLHAFKNLPEMVRRLSAEGHELFVLSNNSKRNVRRFLEEQKMYQYFVTIYGGTGIFGKASALRRLFREQNLEVDNAIYVGDELRDVQAAKAVGLRIVAVSWGFANRKILKAANPTMLVDTPAQLMRALEDI